MWLLNDSNLRALGAALANPRGAARIARAAILARDRTIRETCLWHAGRLPRRPLLDLLPNAREMDLALPRALDREWGTSLTPDEATCLAAVAKAAAPSAILEIGTADGGSALVLAANSSAVVATLDLPPDFDQGIEEVSFDVTPNMTQRRNLGRQLRLHGAGPRVSQHFGDSAKLDWATLGGPFDLIFIDGCHDTPYVRSDTEKALTCLRPGGTIVWHDYGSRRSVSEVVDALVERRLFEHLTAIEGTRLAMGWRLTSSESGSPR